jgi:heat shock protein HslJ
VGLVGIASACGSSSSSDITLVSAKNPNGKSFVVRGTSQIDIPKGVTITFAFTDSQVSFDGGCNTHVGDFKVTDNRLVVTTLRQTERACEMPLMDLDRAVAGFVMTAPAFVYSGDTVTISHESQSITMQEANDIVDKPLEGTTWKVIGTFEGDATQSLQTDPATIVFNGGRAEVFAGCNSGTVTYTVEGTTITFSALALTKKACADAAMTLEATVSKVLDGEKTFDIYGPKLTITDPPGSSTLLKGLDLVGE